MDRFPIYEYGCWRVLSKWTVSCPLSNGSRDDPKLWDVPYANELFARRFPVTFK